MFLLSGLWLARPEYQMFPSSQGTSSLIAAFEDPLTAPSHIAKTAFASTTRLLTFLISLSLLSVNGTSKRVKNFFGLKPCSLNIDFGVLFHVDGHVDSIWILYHPNRCHIGWQNQYKVLAFTPSEHINCLIRLACRASIHIINY